MCDVGAYICPGIIPFCDMTDSWLRRYMRIIFDPGNICNICNVLAPEPISEGCANPIRFRGM
jgi:hypothetical protein